MRGIKLLAIVVILVGCSTTNQPAPSAETFQNYKGWTYAINMLRRDGISEDEIRHVFEDSRVPKFDTVPFKLQPKEHKSLYRRYFSQTSVTHVRQFIKRNANLLNRAYAKYGIEPGVIAAILYVETYFGENTGKEIVFNRLLRIANIPDQNNLVWNYNKLRAEDQRVTFNDVDQRAKYLEKTFYPELKALFEIHKKTNADILSLRGSSAGAFGIPQFLPTTYLKFGTDGNNDGKISLFDLPDAVFSVANFLASFGWKEGISRPNKRQVIWHYNKSAPYIDAILFLADRAK